LSTAKLVETAMEVIQLESMSMLTTMVFLTLHACFIKLITLKELALTSIFAETVKDQLPQLEKQASKTVGLYHSNITMLRTSSNSVVTLR
jgi:hypothetical protein